MLLYYHFIFVYYRQKEAFDRVLLTRELSQTVHAYWYPSDIDWSNCVVQSYDRQADEVIDETGVLLFEFIMVPSESREIVMSWRKPTGLTVTLNITAEYHSLHQSTGVMRTST